ncbi:DNA translocase FtsK [Streptomyces sp. NPDC058629]|uniref:GIY-YIG nuclease family protein n=1 Tax=Streptomyces sp. NPDC058629 TaxID=3346565 RepID=UPI0036471092
MLNHIPAGPHDPLVYFLRNGNRVKIGYTTNLSNRVAALSLTLKFVDLTLPGGRDLETVMHRRFATERLDGTEWFVHSRRLREFIASELAKPPAPDGASDEELIREAVLHVTETQFASASMLQRRMRISFARAQHLMVQLEQRRIVGPLTGRGSTRAVIGRRPVAV